jgi:EAL domain-containing protein (putative c-di-GMP-specific phosphodiesterase class I)
MRHTLGLSVVGEGVETQEQADLLAIQGCDELQGYLFSRPCPADEFEGLLIQEKTPPES